MTRLLAAALGLWLLVACAKGQASHISSPIQVRFESFSVEVGPTNNARPLSIKDADTILGMIEDLITNFARAHYQGLLLTETTATNASANAPTSLRVGASYVDVNRNSNANSNGIEEGPGRRNGEDENNEEEGMEFKYAILGLVNVPTHPEKSRTTTTLEFSGGIAYFGGSGGGGPSAAEVQMLVSLALNEGDLVDALQEEFPYITEATYTRGSAAAAAANDNDNNNDNIAGDKREASTDIGNDEGPDAKEVSALMDSPLGLDGDNVNSQQQFLIVVGSACGAAFVFCILVVFLFVQRQRQRRAFWRDDRRPTAHSGCNKTPICVPEIDAALDDGSLDQGYYYGAPKRSPSKRFSLKSDAKQQSLHLRDSLRDMTGAMQDPDVVSDAGSSRIGRLLTSAAVAATSCAKSATGEDGGDQNLDKKDNGEPDIANNSTNPMEDQDTSSCSNDESSNESVHSKEGYDTCPSDFEGNAIVKPNLLPVTNLDRFSNDDPHNPLPPSQTAAAQQDDSLVILSTDDEDEQPSSPPASFSLATPPKTTQEGFLSKYFNPITGSILPLGSYFSSPAHGDEEEEEDDGNEADCEGPYYQTPHNKKRQDLLTPRTAGTTIGEQASQWSDVTSGYKTDDDFAVDGAWDPDDTSINSSENGKDIFSPMSSSDDDETRLLDSLGKHSYNLHKLRTPTKSKPSVKRGTPEVGDTTAV